jgi:ABC-2 type transport system ATP-binding protein
MSSPIITTQQLTKKFGDFTAVASVDLSVPSGEIFGLLGPNGAGKSTIIKMLSTLLKPTSGTVTLAGYDVVRQPAQVRQSIGMVFQDPSLDDRLTAQENLEFHSMLYGVPPSERPKRIDQVLGMVGLTERRNSLVKTFSGGMKRRLEIARGFMHYPKVLFLDEPTIGLDPQTRNSIWGHVRRLRDEVGITVLMTTHYMDEAENCQTIAIIDNGKIRAIDTPANLKKGLGGDKIIILGDRDLKADVAAKYGVEIHELGDEFYFQTPSGAQFIPRLVTDFAGRIRSIQSKEPTLDDVFLSLTGRVIREDEADPLSDMRDSKRSFTGRWG